MTLLSLLYPHHSHHYTLSITLISLTNYSSIHFFYVYLNSSVFLSYYLYFLSRFYNIYILNSHSLIALDTRRIHSLFTLSLLLLLFTPFLSLSPLSTSSLRILSLKYFLSFLSLSFALQNSLVLLYVLSQTLINFSTIILIYCIPHSNIHRLEIQTLRL